MTLEPKRDEHNPGLWVNPEWQEGTVGTFALIIGVSRYTQLDGGPQPVADDARWVVETRRLGQLKVSALTAHEVFSWLATGYRVEEVPLAKCWLLLSPTDAEHAFRPELQTNAAPPTFEVCRRAIGAWYATMARLAKPAAERSRLLFFFSGHGLEVHQNHQVLLPADYLAPALMSLNDALSTQNLFDGLASLAVCRQFLFVDACRNDDQELRNKRITGAPLLNVDVAAATNPLRVAPLFFATAAGQRAWEQMHPDKGLSLFGRALLDGLQHGLPRTHRGAGPRRRGPGSAVPGHHEWRKLPGARDPSPRRPRALRLRQTPLIRPRGLLGLLAGRNVGQLQERLPSSAPGSRPTPSAVQRSGGTLARRGQVARISASGNSGRRDLAMHTAPSGPQAASKAPKSRSGGGCTPAASKNTSGRWSRRRSGQKRRGRHRARAEQVSEGEQRVALDRPTNPSAAGFPREACSKSAADCGLRSCFSGWYLALILALLARRLPCRIARWSLRPITTLWSAGY